MKEFLSFIKSTTNIITVLLSVILSLIFWIFTPSQQIPLWIFVISLFSSFFLLWAFINSLIALRQQAKDRTFTTIAICNNDICLCNPIPTLTHGVFVTLYLYKNKCEHPIGYGEVTNIQDNDLVRLDVHQLPNTIISNTPLPFTEIISNNKKDIRVKPTVSRKIIDYILNKEAVHNEEISHSQN